MNPTMLPISILVASICMACTTTKEAVHSRANEPNPEIMFLGRTIREVWAMASSSLNVANLAEVKPYFQLAAKTVIDAEQLANAGKRPEWAIVRIAWLELQRQLAILDWTPPLDFEASLAMLNRLSHNPVHAPN